METITNKEPAYTLEVRTGTGSEYREMTSAELNGFFKSDPQYVLEIIDDIIAMCDASEKHKDDYLSYDIDAIRTKAKILKKYLLL